MRKKKKLYRLLYLEIIIKKKSYKFLLESVS